MPSSNGLHPSRSFKLANPTFNRRLRAPPIHSLVTSSGESNGGSSEASSLDDSSSSSGFVEEVLGRRRSLINSKYKGSSTGSKNSGTCSSKDETTSFDSNSDLPQGPEGQSLSSVSSLSDGSSSRDNGASSSLEESVKYPANSGKLSSKTPGALGRSKGTSSSAPSNTTGSHSASPYETILSAMETDPKWKTEKNHGRVIGMYKLYGEIGAGNFAKVKLGIHQLIKEKVAVKIIDKSRVEPKMEKMLVREVNCMESLHHPNIVRLYEVLETTGRLFLISEWAPGGDLYSKVTLRGRLSETEAKPIFRQILSAITFMHTNGIIHRDLKAENIFFSTGTHCKVGDFGFATMSMRGQMLSTFCGSPPYAAPELFRDENYDGGPVDIWALGVLLYFIVEGVLPFVGNSIPALKKAILDGTYELSPTVSPECADLIHGILQQRPFSRLTLSQIIRHSWLQQTFTAKSPPSLDLTLKETIKGHSFDSSTASRNQNYSKKTHELIHRQDTLQLLLPATKNRALSKTIPTRDQVLYGLVSHHELRALEVLGEIGISTTLIEAHRSRGVRSHVVGIYRIILHKLQDGRGVNTKQFFYSNTASAGSLLACVDAPMGLLVPSATSSSSRTGPGIGLGTRQAFRKQLALREETSHVQHSTTCAIL